MASVVPRALHRACYTTEQVTTVTLLRARLRQVHLRSGLITSGDLIDAPLELFIPEIRVLFGMDACDEAWVSSPTLRQRFKRAHLTDAMVTFLDECDTHASKKLVQ
jgi:hypothetical protein